MDVFLKVVAGVFIALTLYLVLQKQGKEISLVLTIIVCCMIVIASIRFLQPVMDFFADLEEMGRLDGDMLKVLVKAVGIGVLSEITTLICTDAGNNALGKTLQMVASAVIAWISIPLFTKLLSLMEGLLEAV